MGEEGGVTRRSSPVKSPARELLDKEFNSSHAATTGFILGDCPCSVNAVQSETFPMKTPAFRTSVGAVKCLVTTFLLAAGSCATAQTPVTNSAQQQPGSNVLKKYEKLLGEAREKPPGQGTIICIGSSQMAFWKTVSTDLAPLTITNYGVPGSKMAQAADLFIPNLVIPFKPRAVILYEGSNDIAADVAPETILAQFQSLHGKLHAALPETRLYVLGLVPSPGKRFAKFDDVKKTNALLQKECETQPWMTFIDTTSPLIGSNGLPKDEYFIPGDIHLMPAGYEIWKAAIAPVVVPVEKVFEK